MDVKNTLIGVCFIALALFLLFKSGEQQKQVRDAQVQEQQTAQTAPVSKQELPPTTADNRDDAAEELFTLENEFIRAVFTNKGGAVKRIELLKEKESLNSDNPYQFNNTDDTLVLALATENPSGEVPILFEKSFKILSKTDDTIIFEYNEPGKTRIIRAFAINRTEKKGAAPYSIETSTKIENLSDQPQSKKLFISLGMSAPSAGDIYGQSMAVGMYDGEKTKFNHANYVLGSDGWLWGLFGQKDAIAYGVLELKKPVKWATVKNQFFASIFTLETAAPAYGLTIPVEVNPEAEQRYMKSGLAGFLAFATSSLAAEDSVKIDGSYYVGPTNLKLLSSMPDDQDLILDFGMFTFISKPLLIFLEAINSVVSKVSPTWSWGWSIIILTIVIRTLMLPLTVMQIRSSQRMMKLQEPIKELKERYKNDPQKLNQETMKLWGEYNVRPFAGCLVAFIQMPIFFGLLYMIRAVGNLRFAKFLWIDDLSLPDTIPGFESVFGISIHLLPIIYALVTFLNMHIMPMPNAQKGQRLMIKLMPFFFLFFFYTFQAGLVLYWTVQSMIGVLQAIVVVRTKDSVVIKKRDPNKPTFMQKMQQRAEDMQKRQEAMKKGTLGEARKKNPGGRSTPSKRK